MIRLTNDKEISQNCDRTFLQTHLCNLGGGYCDRAYYDTGCVALYRAVVYKVHDRCCAHVSVIPRELEFGMLPAASRMMSFVAYSEKGMSLAKAIQYTSVCCAACVTTGSGETTKTTGYHRSDTQENNTEDESHRSSLIRHFEEPAILADTQ